MCPKQRRKEKVTKGDKKKSDFHSEKQARNPNAKRKRGNSVFQCMAWTWTPRMNE